MAVDVARRDTRGVGELVRGLLDDGVRRFMIGLGGSSTNDGGAGLLAALGLALVDAHGRTTAPTPEGLAALDRVDASALDPRLAAAAITVMSDVNNPLTGARGATAIFGPQKGVRPDEVPRIDALVGRFAALVEAAIGRAAAANPGAGAAGGLGFALQLVGGTFRSGAAVVADLVGLDAALAGADWALTGEGRSDTQTLLAKAPFVVAQARARGRAGHAALGRDRCRGAAGARRSLRRLLRAGAPGRRHWTIACATPTRRSPIVPSRSHAPSTRAGTPRGGTDHGRQSLHPLRGARAGCVGGVPAAAGPPSGDLGRTGGAVRAICPRAGRIRLRAGRPRRRADRQVAAGPVPVPRLPARRDRLPAAQHRLPEGRTRLLHRRRRAPRGGLPAGDARDLQDARPARHDADDAGRGRPRDVHRRPLRRAGHVHRRGRRRPTTWPRSSTPPARPAARRARC